MDGVDHTLRVRRAATRVPPEEIFEIVRAEKSTLCEQKSAQPWSDRFEQSSISTAVPRLSITHEGSKRFIVEIGAPQFVLPPGQESMVHRDA